MRAWMMIVGLAISHLAVANGLNKARGILETFKQELTTIVPIMAVITLLGFGLAYAARLVDKDVFIRWSIGLIIAGSAAQITALFFN